MKPHEKLGVAIANAGYDWTPEMRSAWEELDIQADRIAELQEVNGRFADLIQSLREEVDKLREERHGIK